MRKKSLALLLVLVMLLGLAAPTALAEEPEDPALTAEEPAQEQEEPAQEQEEPVQDQEEPAEKQEEPAEELIGEGSADLTIEPSFGISLLSVETGSLDKTSGSHADWLDRVQLPKEVLNFYNALVEAADGDGYNDWLIDPSVANGATEETFSSGTYLMIPIAEISNDDITRSYYAACIQAACAAFDRNHPEVFWLSNSVKWNFYGYAGAATTTCAYVLKVTGTEPYDVRDSAYTSASAIESAIDARDEYIRAIKSDTVTIKGKTLTYSGAKTDYEKVRFFNAWLVMNNQYNTAVSAGNNAAADSAAWECVSALDGRIGTYGPVCEGYARAFKVLCDEAGISCVLVDGKATNSTGKQEAHMWNYVQMEDGKWYAVDVTWDDPTGGSSGAVSGYENENYLLVGAQTSVNGRTFISSHPVENKVAGIYLTNGPKLEDNCYTPPAKVTKLTAEATYNGTTSDEQLTIDVPTKDHTVEVTLTAEATYDNGSTGKVDAEWEIEGNPWGVEISDNKLIIYPNASNPGQTALVQVFASYGGQTACITFVLVKAEAIVTSFDILGPDSITIPNSGSNTAQYSIGNVYDQYGGTMSVPDNVQWSISGPTGVSVDNTGEVTVTDQAVADPTATLTATCGSVHKDFSIDIRSKENAEVTITGVPTEVVEGSEGFELCANVAGVNPTKGFEWTSSNELVLSVQNLGSGSQQAYAYIAVNGPGKATITATYEDEDYYGQASVTITVLKQPALSDFTYTLPESVEYDGNAHPVTVTCSDENMEYTVLYNNKADEPVNAGTYKVTLRVAKGDTYAAADLDLGTLTITKATPTITVPSSLTIVKETVQKLSVTINPADLPLQYSSNKTGVATVAPDGTVHGVSVGTAQITISYAGDKNHEPATATVTVTETTPVEVTFADAASQTYDPSGYALGAQFTAATVEGDKSITKYIYNGTEYGSLSALPTVIDAGTYTVTAVYESDTEYGSKDAAFTITKAKPAITVSDSLTIVKGTAQKLSVTINPADLPLQYSSNKTGVATVAPDGTVRGVSVGTAQITISYAGDKNHEPASVVVQVNVTEKIPVDVTFTAKGDKTYTPGGYKLGAQFDEATVENGETITKYIYNDKDYATLEDLKEVVYNAGTYTVTAVYESDTEYGEAKATFTIEPKDISTSGSVTLSSTSVTYTGTQAPVSVTGVVMDGHTLTASTDYTVSIPTAINAGTYAVTVTGQGNYTGTATTIFEITKATATQAMTTVSADARYGTTGTVALNIAGGTAGTITVSDASNVLNGTPALSNGVLSFVFVDSEANVNKTATITIPVTDAPNYNDYAITVTVTVVDKFLPVLTVKDITTTYTGSPVSASLIRGTATYEGKTVKGTWSWTGGNAPTTVAQSGSYSVTFTPEETDIYANATTTVTVTINKATPAGSPGYTAIKEPGKTLKDAALTMGSFKDGTIKWDDAETTVVQANVSYKWTFTPDDAANYNVVTGRLTPYRVSSDNDSGSSSSGVSKPSTSGGTTTVTTGVTPELSGTTASASVSSSDLNKAVESALETAKDKGTAPAVEIAISTPKRSDTLEVTLPANALEDLGSDREATLTITSGVADVTLDSDAITAVADQAGSKVTLTVAPVKNSDLNKLQREAVGDSPVLSLTLVSGSKVISDFRGGTATVTVSYDLPKGVDAEDVVVWFMDDYGNITPCDTTYNSRTGMLTFETKHFSLYVVGTKSAATTWPFTDVDESHWARTEIAWAYENGYMNGISAATFSPSGTVSRQQVWMILARMAGADPADMAEAKAWSVDSGISDGSNPGGAVSRQQLVSLLYRFAAQYGYNITAKADLSGYPDTAALASYATDAMAWSVANGIIGGTTQGTLNPAGTANRGQFAAILWRFYQTTAV